MYLNNIFPIFPVVCWVDFYFTDYTDYWTKAVLSFFLSFSFFLSSPPDDVLQHFHSRGFSMVLGALGVCFTKPAHWPRWCSSLSDRLSLPTWPHCSCNDSSHITHWVQLFCILPLFIHSPPTLSWVLTLRSRRKAAGPLLCVHSVLNGSRWTGAQNRWEGCWYNRGIGRDPSGPERGWRGGGYWPTTHLLASAFFTFHYQYLISFFPPPIPGSTFQCHRQLCLPEAWCFWAAH